MASNSTPRGYTNAVDFGRFTVILDIISFSKRNCIANYANDATIQAKCSYPSISCTHCFYQALNISVWKILACTSQNTSRFLLPKCTESNPPSTEMQSKGASPSRSLQYLIINSITRCGLSSSDNRTNWKILKSYKMHYLC